MGGTAGDPAAQEAERPDGLRAAGAVFGEPVVELVLAQRRVSALAEVTVDAVRVEAELLQLALELRDVVAYQLVVRLELQHA